MSLLTPQETHALQSFLSAMEPDVSEWSFYAADIPVPPLAHGREALTKATKDLMSLDPAPRPPPAPRFDLDRPDRPPVFPFLRPPPPAAFAFPAPAPAPAPAPPPPPPKRPRDAPSQPPPAKRPRASPPRPPTKPTLLSASQKKANHIQSEQKRRANIRRGYDALCAVVPALRAALREEDAAAAAAASAAAAAPRRGRRRPDDADRPDGRAGPRSEHVVLSKTIDYISDLRAEHAALLARLARARATLPRGHPAGAPRAPGPALWEREWRGGDGRVGDVEEDEDEDADDSS